MTKIFSSADKRSSGRGFSISREWRRSAAILLSAVLSSLPTFCAAAESAVPAQPEVPLTAPALSQLWNDYKNAPDELSWGRLWNFLKDMLSSPVYVMADPQAVISSNPALADLKVKVSETGLPHAKIWSFPRINESHAVLFQAPGHSVVLPLPQAVAFREARFVPGFVHQDHPLPHPQSHTQSAQSRGAVKTAPAAASSPGKFLVLIGGDRVSGNLWFHSYKLAEGNLIDSDVFASLPAFFTQNVTGQASFSGNDIVLSVMPPSQTKVDKVEEPQQGTVKDTITKPRKEIASAGYKVILKFIGGKYLLSGKLPDDAPFSVAFNFSQAVAVGRTDIAKGWLVDPKLISIAKYLGLIGKTNPPMRLVTMSGGGSASRYRLITSAKDDMIIEVGRILTPGRLKGQLAVKALFVAPQDPFAKNLSGTLVLPPAQAPDPAAAAQGNPNSASASGAAGAAARAKH